MPTEKELKDRLDHTLMRHGLLSRELAELRAKPTRKNIKRRRELDKEISHLWTMTGILERDLSDVKKKGGRRTRKHRRHPK